jgi:RNA polymerase sigma-70 factor, ECF subfamily
VAVSSVMTERVGDIALPVGSEPSSHAAQGAAALVREARDGSRAAFGKLYQLYARMVHGILLARVPSTEVDDLLQEVFLLAMRRLAALREPDAFGSWLATIARNRANDFHRGQRPMHELNAETEATGSPAPNSDATQAEAAAALAAIRSLPEAYRETLVLRLVEGMTGPEISERTGLTPASVRVNLHRGMKMLRDALGGRSGSE